MSNGGIYLVRQSSAQLDGPSRAAIDEVLRFVETQSSRAGDQRLPGSSEVLESLIGKGKQLQGRNKNGYTKSVLAMAASVVDLSSETILAQSALAT